MNALMSEVGDKRQKLRKVGLPKERTQEELRREHATGTGGGEIGDLLKSSLKRKSLRVKGTTSPMNLLVNTTATKSQPSLTSGRPPVPGTCTSNNPSPFGRFRSNPSTSCASVLGGPTERARGADTNASAFRDPHLSLGVSVSPPAKPDDESDRDGKATQRMAKAKASNVIDMRSVGDSGPGTRGAASAAVALGGLPGAHPAASDGPANGRGSVADRTSATQPPSPMSSSLLPPPGRAVSSPIKHDSPLVRRKRPSRDKLPGLELGRCRPLTPGRQQRARIEKASRATKDGIQTATAEGEQDDLDHSPMSPCLNVLASPRSPHSPRAGDKTSLRCTKQTRASQSGATTLQDPGTAADELVAEAYATLTGRGQRSPDPHRVFGRA